MKKYFYSTVATLILIIFYASFSLFNYSIIEEDAFIYFRFVENLADGYGYVFNMLGERIEACSSWTWLYLLVFFREWGYNVPTTSKILGIIFGCISLLLTVRINRFYSDSGFWVFAPALLSSLSIPFLMWNQMGMETALYTSVLLLLVLLCLKNSLFFCWPLVAGLLVLTRPEGFLIVLGMLPVFYFQRKRKKDIVLSCAVFLCFLVLMFIGRFLYFHDFMPSPFYHKVSPQHYRAGFYYLHMFFRDYYLYYLFIPLLFIVVKRWNWQKDRSILFWFIFIYLAWVVLAGKEFSKPFYRPLAPVLPLIYIYMISGMERILRNRGLKGTIVGYSYIILFALIIVVFPKNYFQLHVSIANPILENTKRFVAHLNLTELYRDRSIQPLKSGRVLTGEFIKRNYDKGSTFVYDQMGAVPYTAGNDRSFIDMLGLTDKTIGYYYFHQRTRDSMLLKLYERAVRFCVKIFFPDTRFLDSTDEILDYLFEHDPDAFLIWEHILHFEENLSQTLISDDRFLDNYDLKYFIRGTLFFEKKGLLKKPLDIPEGLSVTFAEDIQKVLKQDHPLFQNLLVVPKEGN